MPDPSDCRIPHGVEQAFMLDPSITTSLTGWSRHLCLRYYFLKKPASAAEVSLPGHTNLGSDLALRHGDVLVNNSQHPIVLPLKQVRDAGILQVLFR